MAITSKQEIWLGGNAVLVVVTSGLSTPTFYWYQDGVLVEISERAERIFYVTDEVLDVQVFDDAGTAPAQVHPRRATIQWSPSDFGTARRYIVRRVDAFGTPDTETELAQVSDIGDTPVLSYTASNQDADITDYTLYLRVYPVDDYGNEGEFHQFKTELRGKRETDSVAALSYDNGTDTLTGAWA